MKQQIKFYPGIWQSFGIVGVCILLSFVFSPLAFWLKGSFGIFVYYICFWGTALFFADWMRKRIQGRSVYHFSIPTYHLVPFTIIGSVSIMLLAAQFPLPPLPDSLKQGLQLLASSVTIWSFIFMVLAAPFFEEMIFRGIILAGLLKRCRPLTAIILSAFLFGLVHLNPVQFMSAFPLGLFFGWLYYKTESVLPSILGHFSVNLMGFCLRFTLKTEDFWQETVWSVSQLLYVFMLILLLGISICVLNKIFSKL